MTKRKGALSIEFILLVIIMLTMLGLLSSVHGIINRHSNLYMEVEYAIENVIQEVYLVERIKAQLIDAPKASIQNDQNSSVGWLSNLEKSLEDNLEDYTKKRIQDALNKRILHNKKETLIDYYMLSRPLEFDIEWLPHALRVKCYSYFKVVDMMGIKPEIPIMDVHLIPYKAPIGEVYQASEKDHVIVYLTDNGRKTSHKYHTHMCWAIRRSKTITEHEADRESVLKGSPVFIDRIAFDICKVCKKEGNVNGHH